MTPPPTRAEKATQRLDILEEQLSVSRLSAHPQGEEWRRRLADLRASIDVARAGSAKHRRGAVSRALKAIDDLQREMLAALLPPA